ncbi:phage tail protein [Halomonas sp. I1]|uniref:phage tail protein n=1 Tax=Halomonas sp. I1 TaxID=393536 RepID=UPI0028DF5840|nr:phage tail protein [Halomonas sp. I1]MDT8894177.1 phage tail protein [Halomonas sp. I1]
MEVLPDIGRNPSYGLDEQPQFRVDTAQFGDGYAQRRPSGINATTRTWTLQWELLTKSQADTIQDFLLSQQGVRAFHWTIPETGEEVKVVCRKAPSRVYTDYQLYRVSAVFTEDHNP